MNATAWTCAAAVVAAGCSSDPLAGRPVHARELPIETVGDLALDAVMPSDALLQDDGSVLVLDGYGGRVLRVDAATMAIWPFSTASVGRASRLSPAADGGVWVTRPGTGEEAGSLLHLDPQGASRGLLVPRAPNKGTLHPVDVLDTEGSLVVADRTEGLLWLAAGGVAERALGTGAAPLRRVVDLVAGPGGFFGVDTLSPEIVSLSATGEVFSAFGRRGLSVGTLARPTSLAAVPGGLLVSDSVLGVVQAFEADGDLVGVLGDGSGPLRFDHPIAVRTNPRVPGRVVVLEADPARLRLLRLPGPLPEALLPALLRTTLVEADADPAGENGQSCAACHDGLVLDSRQLWDRAREQHPVDVVPAHPIPAFFPLDDGKLTCRSCHSPHGVVDKTADDPSPLVRHASQNGLFMRLDARSDALCAACHPSDVHGPATTEGRVTVGGGHPAGAALVAALERRGEPETELTAARCLSCHAVHGATRGPLLRASDEASACVGCHEAQQHPETNHPLGRMAGRDLVKATADGRVRLADDGGVGCLTCHDLTSRAKGLLRTLPDGRAVCLGCHAERGDLSHGAHRDLGRSGAPACLACHDLHGGARQAQFVATGPMSEADPRGCLSCHGRGGPLSPGVLGHPVTGAPLANGSAEKLDCLACHDPHLANRPDSADCVACHAEQGAAKEAGGHGSAECLDCHGAHRADPAWSVATPSGSENPASGRCLACHAASRATDGVPVVADYTHPSPMFLPDGQRWTPLAGLVLFGKDGEPVPSGQNGDLTCQSCHVVHGPDGSADHLRRAIGWQAACAACHGDEGLVYYRFFHSPERRASLTREAP